jgi:hypothetical protein
VTRQRNGRATVTAGEISPATLWLGSRDGATSEVISSRLIPSPIHPNTSASIVPLIFVFVSDIFSALDLQCSSELKRPNPLGLKCDTITSPRRLVNTFIQ